MNSMEFNKIAAGIISALLVLLLVKWGAESIYGTGEAAHHDYEHLAFEIELPEGGGETEVAEEAGPPIGEFLMTASAEEGATAFRACQSCHSADSESNGTGPYLLGVMGRDIASVGAYDYSPALAGIEGDWTAEALSAFIEAPRDWAPGTKMGYSGMRRPQDRANVIAYLVETAGQTLEDFIVIPEETTEAEVDAAAAEAEAEALSEDAAEAGETEGLPTGAEGGVTEAGGDDGDVAATADDVEITEDAVTTSPVRAPEAEDTNTIDPETSEAVAEENDGATASAVVEGDGDAPEGDATPAQADGVVEDVETDEQTARTDTSDAETGGVAPPAEGDPEEPTAGGDEAQLEAEADAEAPEPGESVEEAPATDAEPAQDDAAATDGDVPAFMQSASAEAGEGIFRRCRSCHLIEDGNNRTGPHLYGVVGRDIGSVEGFRYSSAMEEKDGVWDYEALDAYLENPRGWLPGTRMSFAGLRDQQDRADVIAYIEAQSE
ncbi:c-type cytochrome [Roseobacter sp. HKCCA0434]|uniref:c-type cytochrome n=1 Tax=Roseobacter sp. HKCCA0434 TaxID=3079297 RepID=UPI002905CCBA|nr:c-type cytochrome [Roseobacter sp. HKCCA0434]